MDDSNRMYYGVIFHTRWFKTFSLRQVYVNLGNLQRIWNWNLNLIYGG